MQRLRLHASAWAASEREPDGIGGTAARGAGGNRRDLPSSRFWLQLTTCSPAWASAALPSLSPRRRRSRIFSADFRSSRRSDSRRRLLPLRRPLRNGGRHQPASTRVRTDARTELPSRMHARHHEHREFTRRDKIQFSPALAIRYETTADQLRYCWRRFGGVVRTPESRKYKRGHTLRQFDSSALRLEIAAYVLTRDSNEFIAIREDLLCGSWDRRKIGTGSLSRRRPCIFARFRSRQGENRSREQQVQQWRATQTALPGLCG